MLPNKYPLILNKLSSPKVIGDTPNSVINIKGEAAKNIPAPQK